MNGDEAPRRQSKFSDIDSALGRAEVACEYLENALDILHGTNEPAAEKTSTPDKCFVEVYVDISARVKAMTDRIRSATDRMQEMLV